MLKEFLDIIVKQKPEYVNNVNIIQDALMKGLEIIKEDI